MFYDTIIENVNSVILQILANYEDQSLEDQKLLCTQRKTQILQ